MEKDGDRRKQEQDELKQAREKGQLLDFAELKTMLAKVAETTLKPMPKIHEVAKTVYTPLPAEELKRRMKAQLKAVREKYGK